MVELLGSPRVDADGADELIKHLVVNLLSVLALDMVVAPTVLHDE